MGQITVTGAAGFVGRHIVDAALAAGHDVIAVTRQPVDLWAANARVTSLVLDLMEATPADLAECKVVIHAAAAMEGGEDVQLRDTVEATTRLLDAVPSGAHIVLVGSLSVYGCQDLKPGSTLDERTPIEDDPAGRDAYCRSKLMQEEVAFEAVQAGRITLNILRLGAVIAPGRLGNGHLGIGVGSVLLRIGAGGEVPVIDVKDAADAVVIASQKKRVRPLIANIVASDLPDRRGYADRMRSMGWPRIVVPVPLMVLRVIARVLPRAVPRPGLLRPAVIAARLRPLRYSNEAAQKLLGWTPKISFTETARSGKGTGR